MRAVLISDTHRRHHELTLPDGDLLIHAGDVSGHGTVEEIADFMLWFGAAPHAHKVLIAGNHDFLAERDPARFAELVPDSVTYLKNSGAVIAGVEIWGSPITPWFHDWAFNRERGSEIKQYWDRIPESTEILVTHGPPYGILDLTVNDENVGCEELLKRIADVRPRLHVFGHIHEAQGEETRDGTRFVNACVLDARYRPAFAPTVVDL